jgi:hypothetical protein
MVIRFTVAAGFVLAFLAIGLLAALAPTRLGAILVVEALAAGATGIVVACELRPALARLRSDRAGGAGRLAVRELRRALDELPETPHPLGL